MSGFSADWLALREQADAAARSPLVLKALRRRFAGREAVTVCDLGAGTGAAVAAFGPFLPARQRWLLVDNDSANLAAAKRQREMGMVTVEPILANLADDASPLPAPWPAPGFAACDLVTATALFDLASPAWITRLADRLAAAKAPLLAALTYDGHQEFSVTHPADAAMLVAFNRHQRLDKGLGGPAAGPDGATVLAAALEANGYDITIAPSPWRLDGERDAALIASVLEGWAAAVVDARYVSRQTADDWRQAHLAVADSLCVGHWDLLALPPR